MGGKWSLCNCFAGHHIQDLFKMERSIPVHFSSSLFSMCLINVQVVYPYSSIDPIYQPICSGRIWHKVNF